MKNMHLHQDKDVLDDLINRVSKHFYIDKKQIEKDYWVCKILKDVAQSNLKDHAFFKGGTSLSKAYKVINRFSEDLDLSVFSGNFKTSFETEKKLVRNVSHSIINNNTGIYREDLSKSTFGDTFRKLFIEYNQAENDNLGLKEFLEIEIKCCILQGDDKKLAYYPTDLKTVSPLITEYLKEINRVDILEQYDLNEFEIKCINPRKTLCDKISRMVRISTNENYIKGYAEHIRDVYDVHSLYNIKEYKDYINSEEFLSSMYKTFKEDSLAKIFKSIKFYDNAVIFSNPEQILNTVELKNAYSNSLQKLIYGNNRLPTNEEFAETLKNIQPRLVEFEKYRVLTK